MESIQQLTAHLFRENSGKMVAVLSRVLGLDHIDLIMDIIQDTFETALTTWRFNGIPQNPPAWLMTVAKNKALNTIRRGNKLKDVLESEKNIMYSDSSNLDLDFNLHLSQIEDSQLKLLLLCCDSSLSPKNQIAITLNILCGFKMPEIANALLMNDEAVKKSIARSKEILRKKAEWFKKAEWIKSDLNSETILLVLYLMFNEAYKTTKNKEAINHDLSYEAIRLAKLLINKTELLQSQIYALLAIMFFNISRFPARLSASNEWISLEEQDRSLWNYAFIEEGFYYLRQSKHDNPILTKFHIEAIIASFHCSAKTFLDTNWSQIIHLYELWEKIDSSPLITLNKIIAESYLTISKSLKAIDDLETKFNISDYSLLAVAKADIYRRKGDYFNAIPFYKKAMELSSSEFDIKFLERKINECQQALN